jgi:hypothetical protein
MIFFDNSVCSLLTGGCSKVTLVGLKIASLLSSLELAGIVVIICFCNVV